MRRRHSTLRHPVTRFGQQWQSTHWIFAAQSQAELLAYQQCILLGILAVQPTRALKQVLQQRLRLWKAIIRDQYPRMGTLDRAPEHIVRVNRFLPQDVERLLR